MLMKLIEDRTNNKKTIIRAHQTFLLFALEIKLLNNY